MKILKLRTKGQTELSEFMLKLIAATLFTVFLVGGILAISQFKAQINENAGTRLSIDFGENVLAAPCLTEKKGLFNETMLNSELSYSSTHYEDRDGISCLGTSVVSVTRIKTESKNWLFGSKHLESLLADNNPSRFEFPAVLNNSDGNIFPAKLFVALIVPTECGNGNKGLNCYNCMEAEKCEKEGCRWEAGICEY